MHYITPSSSVIRHCFTDQEIQVQREPAPVDGRARTETPVYRRQGNLFFLVLLLLLLKCN